MIMGMWGASMQISVWLGQGIQYQWQGTDNVAGNSRGRIRQGLGY